MTRREWMALAAIAPLYAEDSSSIAEFFNSFLDKWVMANPEMATGMRIFSGDVQDRLDGQLTDIGDGAAHARIALAKDGLAGLKKFDRLKLTPEQRISAEMLDYQLSDIVAEEPFLIYNFPLNQMRGVQSQIPSLLTDLHPLRNQKDAENYLARLSAAGSKIDQALQITQTRARQGIRLPGFIAFETIGQMKRFTQPAPAQNILVASFTERLKKIGTMDDAKKSAMAASAEKLVRDSVYPSYYRAVDGLSTDNAKATNDAGLWRLPHGAEAYSFYLRRFTTTDMTATQIHQKGLDEVKRIEGEMDSLFQKIGYKDGSIIARFEKLQNDNMYPATPDVRDRVLADYAAMLKQNNERSLEAFDRRPKAACIVQRIPAFQEANAAANYQGPPKDGSRPGIFRVPLPGPKFAKPGMRTLAAHEGIPGHHFQIASQVEMTSLPAFRRQNPFGSMSAYTEGWGLYAEGLASELGWYKDDVPSDLGRLNGELFRAKRLVVDTGIHAQKWTREQSIAYGIRQSEVDRYVVMPGQACSYKIGQMRILELREEAKRALGPKFSLKAFHNVVLGNGAIPLTLLSRVVKDWQNAAQA